MTVVEIKKASVSVLGTKFKQPELHYAMKPTETIVPYSRFIDVSENLIVFLIAEKLLSKRSQDFGISCA